MSTKSKITTERTGARLRLTVDCDSEADVAEVEAFLVDMAESKMEEIAANRPHEFVSALAQAACEVPGCHRLGDAAVHGRERLNHV